MPYLAKPRIIPIQRKDGTDYLITGSWTFDAADIKTVNVCGNAIQVYDAFIDLTSIANNLSLPAVRGVQVATTFLPTSGDTAPDPLIDGGLIVYSSSSAQVALVAANTPLSNASATLPEGVITSCFPFFVPQNGQLQFLRPLLDFSFTPNDLYFSLFCFDVRPFTVSGNANMGAL